MPIAAFLSYIFLTAYTPGPNNIMAMSTAVQHGFGKAFRFSIGTLFGFVVVMTACAIFTTTLYAYIPSMEPYLRLLGAGYILYLAWVIFRSKPKGMEENPDKACGVVTGMLLQCVNVKVIIYGLTALSTFVLPHFQDVPRLVFFVLILSLTGFSGTVCWALFGSALERLFVKHYRKVNLALAILLVYCAVSLL